jgi:rod shape-determining protein MreC
MADTNQIGSVTGTGKELSSSTTLKLTLFDANAVLTTGEDLVTFGSVHNTPYVPGVPIGQVTKVEGDAGALTQTALVKPFVDFTSLGVVGVVVGGPAKDPHDSVLPSGPKPAPTVTVTVTPSASSGNTGNTGNTGTGG